MEIRSIAGSQPTGAREPRSHLALISIADMGSKRLKDSLFFATTNLRLLDAEVG